MLNPPAMPRWHQWLPSISWWPPGIRRAVPFLGGCFWEESSVRDENLVGGDWNIWMIFPKKMGMSSSQLTSSMIFQRGRAQPPTRNVWK